MSILPTPFPTSTDEIAQLLLKYDTLRSKCVLLKARIGELLEQSKSKKAKRESEEEKPSKVVKSEFSEDEPKPKKIKRESEEEKPSKVVKSEFSEDDEEKPAPAVKREDEEKPAPKPAVKREVISGFALFFKTKKTKEDAKLEASGEDPNERKKETSEKIKKMWSNLDDGMKQDWNEKGARRTEATETENNH